MPPQLHSIERWLIKTVGSSTMAEEDLFKKAEADGMSPDQVRRGTQWLRHKTLAVVTVKEGVLIWLGPHGLEALDYGLPEIRLAARLGAGPVPISELQKNLGKSFGSAVGMARKRGWVKPSGDQLVLVAEPDPLPLPETKVMEQIGRNRINILQISDTDALAALQKRPGFIESVKTHFRWVTLSPHAAEAAASSEEGAIDVEAAAPPAYPARAHPLTEVIEEIRDAFVALGFEEVAGPMVQPGFWNFDALFTPQDHPAREMQDTFYLDAPPAKAEGPALRRRVAAEHRRGWGYEWDPAEARRQVLRTHTTCVTIRHLAEARPREARAFSLGRVFRNEKPSYKHLPEFHQVEGVVAGGGATLRGLMGIQEEFYRMIGLGKVRFWPTFFPYTEPSLQSMVYNERLGKWVEMFGMGIFRPEVTRPLGIRGPVLAWGGGIERIAMIKYGVDDVRRFYSSDLGWLRGAARCR